MPFNEKGEFIRTRRSAAQSCDSTELSRDDLLTVAKGFGALLLVAGLIWFVVVIHKWILISLGLWLARSLRA